MAKSAFYNPYFVDETGKNIDLKGNPQYPIFFTENFIRDIRKIQTIKLFKVVLSSYINLPASEKDYTYTVREPNIYYADYCNVRDVINGRAKLVSKGSGLRVSQYRYGLPFDGNLAEWRDTMVNDDVLICHYYNPSVMPLSRSSDVTEVIYFLYDIVRPKRDGSGNLQYRSYTPAYEVTEELHPPEFRIPVYESVETNKIAAIGRTRGVDDQLYNYTHNWYYFDLQGFEVRCRFKIPAQDEVVSGITDNTGNSAYPIIHRHTTSAVEPDDEITYLTNTRPPNMRDAHDRLISDIVSKCEVQSPRDMDIDFKNIPSGGTSDEATAECVRRMIQDRGLRPGADGRYSMILPSGDMIQLWSDHGKDLVARISSGAVNSRDVYDGMRTVPNVLLASEDAILDKGAQGSGG